MFYIALCRKTGTTRKSQNFMIIKFKTYKGFWTKSVQKQITFRGCLFLSDRVSLGDHKFNFNPEISLDFLDLSVFQPKVSYFATDGKQHHGSTTSNRYSQEEQNNNLTASGISTNQTISAVWSSSKGSTSSFVRCTNYGEKFPHTWAPTTTICGSWMASVPTVLNTSCSLLITGMSWSI